jgi:hypothetical protein
MRHVRFNTFRRLATRIELERSPSLSVPGNQPVLLADNSPEASSGGMGPAVWEWSSLRGMCGWGVMWRSGGCVLTALAMRLSWSVFFLKRGRRPC